VTACVDEISFFPEYFEHSARNDDLILNGEVVWVGRSSMDVLCSLENDKGQPLVQSHFIMVARCPQTGKAAPVVPLKPETEAEIRNYELAEKLNKVSKYSLLFRLAVNNSIKILNRGENDFGNLCFTINNRRLFNSDDSLIVNVDDF